MGGKFNVLGGVEDGSGAGGLYGAGFGIAVDPKGPVWATNFGFQSLNCPNDPTGLFTGVSKFNAEGAALSPDGDPHTSPWWHGRRISGRGEYRCPVGRYMGSERQHLARQLRQP